MNTLLLPDASVPLPCAPPGAARLHAARMPDEPPALGHAPLDLSAVGDLPALPAAVLDLLRLLGSAGVDARTLAARIACDQALTAKTLRLANSPFYGVSRRVTSVLDATTVLGLRAIRVLVTGAALVGSFKPPACPGFDFMAFWRHAIHSAVGARLVAVAIGSDGEVAFTAGLLHDVGQLALASISPERFARVLAQTRGDRELELQDAERRLLGLDHAAAGAYLAEHWHFPREIVEAIGQHHRTCAIGAVAELAHVVRVAGVLAHGLEMGDTATVPPSCAGLWAASGLSPEDWPRFAIETASHAQAICAVLLK